VNVPDSGFESSAWTLAGLAEITPAYGAHGGVNALAMRHLRSFIDGSNSEAVSQSFGLEPGQIYGPLKLWAKVESGASFSLGVYFDRGDGSWTDVGTIGAGIGSAWQEFDSGTWEALGTVGRVRFLTVGSISGGLATTRWLVDDISLGGPMLKLRDIETAMVAAVGAITSPVAVGSAYQGYRLDENISTWPEVQILAVSERNVGGDDDRGEHELHRKKRVATLRAWIWTRGSASMSAAEEGAEIRGSLERTVEAMSGGMFLGKGYIDEVMVGPLQQIPADPSAGRGAYLWQVDTLITYRYDRLDP